MRVIPAIHHLEILALRERLHSGMSHWQMRFERVQPAMLEEFIERHALLRDGVRSICAGRELILAFLIGWLMGLRDDPSEIALIRAQNHRQLEPRVSKTPHADVDLFGANHALRFEKSCVLWLRYLG